MDLKMFDKKNNLSKELKIEIAEFLYTHLDKFGDPLRDIKKAINYVFSESASKGGFVIVSYQDAQISGVLVMNKTGMQGYIPENILVYVATQKELRGQGIGQALLQEAIACADGDIALHVEAENPAMFLYKKLGFENKYLEMRLIKK